MGGIEYAVLCVVDALAQRRGDADHHLNGLELPRTGASSAVTPYGVVTLTTNVVVLSTQCVGLQPEIAGARS